MALLPYCQIKPTSISVIPLIPLIPQNCDYIRYQIVRKMTCFDSFIPPSSKTPCRSRGDAVGAGAPDKSPTNKLFTYSDGPYLAIQSASIKYTLVHCGLVPLIFYHRHPKLLSSSCWFWCTNSYTTSGANFFIKDLQMENTPGKLVCPPTKNCKCAPDKWCT